MSGGNTPQHNEAGNTPQHEEANTPQHNESGPVPGDNIDSVSSGEQCEEEAEVGQDAE